MEHMKEISHWLQLIATFADKMFFKTKECYVDFHDLLTYILVDIS